MCKVLIKKPKENIDFIIYNHLFSQSSSYTFTVEQLFHELQKYHLGVSIEYVRKIVNDFIEAGMIIQKFRCYSVCWR